MRLFDLHCDTLTACLDGAESLWANDRQLDIRRGRPLFSHWAQVMAVYVPDGLTPKDAYDYLLRSLSYLDEQEKTIEAVRIVRTADDLNRTLSRGKTALLPALENGSAVASDLNVIDKLAAQGIVYITVTWNGENPLGHGCMSHSRDGLTPLGKDAVRRMLSCGIVPDVSHLNERGFWDVAALCDGQPMMASHSVSRAVHEHPRNLTDEQFAAVKQAGGIVGINLCESQLGEQSFTTCAKHLEHFLSLGGENMLALGLDLDGTPLCKEWGDVTFLPKFYEFLLKSYEQSLLDKIFFENAQAFFVKTLTRKEECITIGL